MILSSQPHEESLAVISAAGIPRGDSTGGTRRHSILHVTRPSLHMFLLHIRKIGPEKRSDVVAWEDPHSSRDQRHAPQPAVVVFPKDADPFSFLQLQLVRPVSHVGVESHAPGETKGEVKGREGSLQRSHCLRAKRLDHVPERLVLAVLRR